MNNGTAASTRNESFPVTTQSPYRRPSYVFLFLDLRLDSCARGFVLQLLYAWLTILYRSQVGFCQPISLGTF